MLRLLRSVGRERERNYEVVEGERLRKSRCYIGKCGGIDENRKKP